MIEHEDGNYFSEYNVGDFWGLWETRDWCRKLIDLAFKFKAYNTNQSTKQQIAGMIKMMYWNRGDNKGLRRFFHMHFCLSIWINNVTIS